MPGRPPSENRRTEKSLVEETLDVVRDLLVDVIGPEYLIGLTIDLDTSFDVDLQLESLEFVALAERLLERYGDQVDFVAWLATMELDEIIALTVGDLVAFVASNLTSVPTEAGPATPDEAGPVTPADTLSPARAEAGPVR